MSKEELSSLFWLGLAIVICISSFRLSLGTFQYPGPGFFPFIAGSLMGVLAAVVYLQARRAASAAKEGHGSLWAKRGGVKKIVLLIITLLAYTASMEYLGFLISTFIFLVFVLRIIEPQRWGLVIIESVLASGLAYLIFDIWLQAQLPRGVFL